MSHKGIVSTRVWNNPFFSMRKLDLTGLKFNRLTVISECITGKKKAIYWNCLCDCGRTSITTTTHLKSGHSKSCGCYSREATSKARKIHGLSKSSIYRILQLMINRCYNKKSPAYKYYGARGIKVCPEWLISVEAFAKDMGERPSLKHSVDRRNNNGDYCKENCYWATDLEQSRNRRSTIYINFKGQRIPLIDFCKEVGQKYKTVHIYLKKYGEEKTICFYCGSSFFRSL